jgi:hypothetical protein
MMKWFPLLASLLASPSYSAGPFARASVDATDGIVPGQQLRVIVEVFAPDFFTAPPEFPLFDIPNALVTFSAARAQNMVQTIDGQQYSGIRKVYAVVPEQAGTITVPSIEIPLGWSMNGKPTKGEVATAPFSFDVDQGTGVFFAAKGLTIAQAFDRKPTALKVGDAVVRTITITAFETQGLTMPAIDFGDAKGMRAYSRPPKIEDGLEIGRDTASRRTETVVYTVEKEGNFTLPPVSYPWFDVDARQDEAASLPKVTMTVAAAPENIGIAPEQYRNGAMEVSRLLRQRLALAFVALAGLAATAWAGRRLWPKSCLLLHSLAIRRAQSRGYRLRQLRRTIRTAAPGDVYAALHEWSRNEGYRTLADWLSNASPTAGREVAALEKGLFGGGATSINRAKLASTVGARKRLALARRAALAPLNPT